MYVSSELIDDDITVFIVIIPLLVVADMNLINCVRVSSESTSLVILLIYHLYQYVNFER